MLKVTNKVKYREHIQNIMMFRYLTKEQLDALLEASDLYLYKYDEYIVREGEVKQELFAVVKGSVQVSVSQEGEKDVYICTFGDGEVFGEAGIFMRVKRTADVISLEDTVVLAINRENMMKFIKTNKDAGIKFLMVIIYSLLRKLREANQELAFERQCDAEQIDVDAIINDFMDDN